MLAKFDRRKNLSLVQDKMKRNLTVALFEETEDGRTDIKPLWSLKDWKEVYLDLKDPTEYLPAIHLIGDWDHWNVLVRSYAVGPYILSWREELKVKLRALAIANIVKQAQDPRGTAAAKWLAENGFEAKLPKASKTQKLIEETSSDIVEHSKRMGVA